MTARSCLLRLISVLLFPFAAAVVAGGAPLRSPVYFDAAPAGVTREGRVALTPSDTYDAVRGYGWTTAPTDTFSHPQFGGVRSGELLDGVMGLDFTLRLNLAPGRWTAIVFLDDGYENAHRNVIEWNGRAVTHNPRVFGSESEPSPPPTNRYRVAQFVLTAEQRPVDLRLRQSDAPGARLLAVQLLPMDWEETEVTRWLRRQVDDAGRHDFRASIDILRSELERHARTAELTACATYWKAQLDLLAEAQRWHQAAGWDEVSARTRSSMFARYKIAVSLLDPLVEHPDGDAFPLRDRARWLRARLLYWLWAEQHIPVDHAAYTADLEVLRKKYPDDLLIAMYAGEKIPDQGRLAAMVPQAAAPAWSTAQFEALQRLRDVAGYWIDERQIPNGEFGGKTDDDVELLRWWPVLMLSGDTKVTEGFRKMAEGMWFSPRMHLGYSRVAKDVEHSAEFVSDTVPMMAFVTRDREWISRLAFSHRHMRDLWTGRNDHGDLLFKSAWLGATDILTDPPRNRDLSMNARAAKAVRYYAWLTGDQAAARLLHDWSLAWAKAAAGSDKGKPRGLFPASLRWPDSTVNGDEPSWHRANMFWRYFDWTGDGRLYDQLLYSWIGTRDERLLEPLRTTLEFLRKWSQSSPNRNAPEGSEEWAAARLLGSAEFWNVAAQWRFESGDSRYDSFLVQYGPPYLRYRLTGDTAPLTAGIKETLLDVLRFNRPMRTSEVLFTDRVYVSEDSGNVDGADLLAGMLTGSHTAQGMSPYFHVAWEQAPGTFTALVSSTGSDQVAAEVFLHQTEPARVTARFFRLPPGSYRLTLVSGARTITDRIETITGPDHRAVLELPGSAVVSVKLARVVAP